MRRGGDIKLFNFSSQVIVQVSVYYRLLSSFITFHLELLDKVYWTKSCNPILILVGSMHLF